MKTPFPIAGSIAQRAGYGGHAWVFVQYLLGLRSLGYQPLLIDKLTSEMCLDPYGGASEARRQRCIRWLTDVMRAAGLDRSYSLQLDEGQETVGLPRDEVLQRVAQAPALLNVMGFITDEDVLGAAESRVFLDLDPGFGQMWRELGLADVFKGHDAFVTIGENIGESDCTIPTCGLNWITTRPPVSLDQWAPADGGSAFTTVASWRGPFAPIEYNGTTYGLRAHEFRRFADLPRLATKAFEVALDVDSADQRDIDLLQRGGWALVDPTLAAGSTDRYRRYIQASKAEVMIAKQIYVETQSGWFSDRSACYLASGKPVLAQDTGFSRNYPVGKGLVSFRDIEDAAEGVRGICADWEQHSVAARDIAEEYFDARKVLRRLLDDLGAA